MEGTPWSRAKSMGPVAHSTGTRDWPFWAWFFIRLFLDFMMAVSRVWITLSRMPPCCLVFHWRPSSLLILWNAVMKQVGNNAYIIHQYNNNTYQPTWPSTRTILYLFIRIPSYLALLSPKSFGTSGPYIDNSPTGSLWVGLSSLTMSPSV